MKLTICYQEGSDGDFIMSDTEDSKMFIDMSDEDKWTVVNMASVMLDIGEPTRLYLKRLLDYNQLLVKHRYFTNGVWDMNRAFSLVLNSAGELQTNLIAHNDYNVVGAQRFLDDEGFLVKVEDCCIKGKGNMREFEKLRLSVLNY